MSLSEDGLTNVVKGGHVVMEVEGSHPLITLANQIDWVYLSELVQPDLKKTQKHFWWLGRKLYLRVHLAVMILQMLFKWTDRGTEAAIQRTALYQLFCGLRLISKWRCPDHTKIEEFRNRLSPETQKEIADYIVQLAVGLGFALPSDVDIDSTVQEANMSYPSDATLMKKLSVKCHTLFNHLKERGKQYISEPLMIKYKGNNQGSSKLLLPGKKHLYRKKEGGICELSFIGEERAKAFDKATGNPFSESTTKASLELQRCGYRDKRKGLALSFRRSSFCKDTYHQKRCACGELA